MITQQYIYRQELLSLGLKYTHISAILSYVQPFKSIPKKHGHPFGYNWRHSLLMYIGCECLSLGLSLRHVSQIIGKANKLSLKLGGALFIFINKKNGTLRGKREVLLEVRIARRIDKRADGVFIRGNRSGIVIDIHELMRDLYRLFYYSRHEGRPPAALIRELSIDELTAP